MDENNLRAKIISEEIESQESQISLWRASIKDAEKLIRENEIRIEYASKSVEQLRIELQSYGNNLEQPHPIEKLVSPMRDTFQSLSKETTFALLNDSNDKNGIQIKHIEKMYNDAGIKAQGRQIFRHIEELIKEGKAYQVNPEARRSRRYCAIKEVSLDEMMQ